MDAIVTEDLRKTFTVRRRSAGRGRERVVVEAVAGVDLRVEPGEMLGYIGPNGAGKSTTVKMFTGVLMPSGGTVRVAGLDPVRRRVELARRIGVVFGQRTQLWWDLPLRDSFDLLRHIYRVPAPVARRNLDTFTELLDMGPFLGTPVRQLSLGQRMRGDLAAALLHEPGIVFLDEPTIGLDVVAKARIREFLARVNAERGVTVVLTTHDLSDVERLCRRLVVIDHGRVLFDGTPASLTAIFGGASVLVVDLERASAALDVPGCVVERMDGPRQWLRFKRGEVSAASLVAAVAARAPLVDLSITEPSIEEVVRRIYEKGTRR